MSVTLENVEEQRRQRLNIKSEAEEGGCACFRPSDFELPIPLCPCPRTRIACCLPTTTCPAHRPPSQPAEASLVSLCPFEGGVEKTTGCSVSPVALLGDGRPAFFCSSDPGQEG